MKRTTPVLLVLAVMVSWALLQAQQATPARSSSEGSTTGAIDGATGNDWPSYGGTTFSWRYSTLAGVNRTNVSRLAPAWIFQTADVENGLQATPIVSNGILYLMTSRIEVYALDGSSGRIMWEYKYQPSFGSVVSRAQKGVAVANGKVFFGTADGYVVALDQKTGQEVWKVAAEDASTCRCGFATGAPLVANDKVVLGMTGSRGSIAAFDVNTGRMAWRFYTVPAAGEKGSETWQGDSWKSGGARPWLTGSYDPDLGLVYWGTGDPMPMIYGGARKGDNLYSASIVALEVSTGKLRWYFQEVPHDVWDYDASWETVLLDREVRGRNRKVLVHFGKNGYTYLLDRQTGEYLGSYRVNEYVDWVERIGERGEPIGRKDPVEGQVSSSCPGNLGGKSWNHTAYSPRTGLIYSPSMEMCQDITLNPPKPGDPNDRGSARFVFKAPPGRPTAYGRLDAMDVVTGKKRWSYEYKYALTASILATAGNLIFTGDPEGNFFALDAETGKKLWSFPTGAGHRGGSVTYMANGRQYIATPTGFGSVVDTYFVPLWPEAERWPNGSALVVFALPDSK